MISVFFSNPAHPVTLSLCHHRHLNPRRPPVTGAHTLTLPSLARAAQKPRESCPRPRLPGRGRRSLRFFLFSRRWRAEPPGANQVTARALLILRRGATASAPPPLRPGDGPNTAPPAPGPRRALLGRCPACPREPCSLRLGGLRRSGQAACGTCHTAPLASRLRGVTRAWRETPKCWSWQDFPEHPGVSIK